MSKRCYAWLNQADRYRWHVAVSLVLSAWLALAGPAVAVAASTGRLGLLGRENARVARTPSHAALRDHLGRASHDVAGGSVSVKFSSLGWTMQTVSGPKPTLDLYVPGPGDVTFGPATHLYLMYSRSPLLRPGNASVSVFVNDVYIGAAILADGTKGPGTLTLTIPSTTLIAQGSNHLHLIFGLRDPAVPGACATDPALSAAIYGTSSLRYDVRGPKQSAFDLGSLPAPFVSPTGSSRARITVSLPGTPTRQELEGIGNVLARMGEDASSQPPAVTSQSDASRLYLATESNVLVIGTPRDNPAIARIPSSQAVRLKGGQWTDARGQVLPPTEGIILETRSPWARRSAVLLLSGNGQEGIRRAAVMLSSATLRRLLHGSAALLPTAPTPPPASRPSHRIVTFDNLGYTAFTAEGDGDHSTRYSFDLEGDPLLPGQLTLVYGHSATAIAPISSIRVDLNDHPLVSRQFNVNDPQRIRWIIPLPANQLHIGTNIITVHVYLGTPGPGCTIPPMSSLWSIVDAASTLALPATGGTTGVDLGLLPFPLVFDADPHDTVLVVPARTTDAPYALNLAVLLGTQSNVDAPQLTVVSDEQVSRGQLEGHPVLLDGLPAASPLMSAIKNQLPLRMGSNGFPLQLLGQNTVSQAAARENSALGIVEEVPSPWGAAQSVIVVVASRPDLLPIAQTAMFTGQLNGTAASIDAAGRVQTFDTRSRAHDAPHTRPAPRPIKSLSLFGLGLLAIIMALTAVRTVRP